MFTITMLPARQGDCLWIEYGDESGATPHRILIDCGTSSTYDKALKAHLEALGPDLYIDLFIVTHIDTDHIGGVLELLENPPAGLRIGQVWFNAWRHLEPDALDLLGPIDGEILSVQLDRTGWKWNTSFRQKGHAAAVRSSGPLRSYRLPGSMTLTLLSPGTEQLRRLRDNWETVIRQEGLAPGEPSTRLREKAARKGVKLDFLGPADPVRAWADAETDLDETPANGSTIAVLAEREEEDGTTKSCLLAGDAYAPVLAAGIQRLAEERGEPRLRVDAFKLPHHGSRRNVTRELLEGVDCRRYLFSSDGTIYKHPDPEAVARVILYGGPRPILTFNCRTKFTEPWANPAYLRRHRYSVEFGDGSATVTL